MPEHTHARLMSNAMGASHSKNEIMLEKNLRNLPNFTLKKNKRGKQKLHFWSFSRVYKGRGLNSCFQDSTHSQRNYGRGIVLTGFYLNATGSLWLEYHILIVLSICPPPPPPFLPLLYLLTVTPHSFLKLNVPHNPLCALLQNYRLIKLFHSNVPQEEGRRKKRGERAVGQSNRNTDTELRTESSGMPK